MGEEGGRWDGANRYLGRMLRRAAPWLLLLAVTALGYAQFAAMLGFTLQRAAVQRAIKLRLKQGVPEEELSTFTLTAAQLRGLRWVKPGREFRLDDGRMFDVVYRHDLPDGTTVLRCIADHQETALFAGLKEHVARDQERRAPGTRERVLHLLLGLVGPPAGPAVPDLRANGLDHPDARCGTPSDGWATAPAPPPEAPVHG